MSFLPAFYSRLPWLLTDTNFLCVDVFKFDPEYLKNEEMYKEIKIEILGEESDEDESGEEGDEDEDDESDDEPDDGISTSFPSFLVSLLLSSGLTVVLSLEQKRMERSMFMITRDRTSSTFVVLFISPSFVPLLAIVFLS